MSHDSKKKKQKQTNIKTHPDKEIMKTVCW